MFMARPWCACWYSCLERRLQQREDALNARERRLQELEAPCGTLCGLRCCAPGDVRTISHGDILQALEVAFDRPLQGDFLPRADRELRASMLLAFHKLKVRRNA